MQRRPITFDEKVDARFTRRSRSECWWWEGSLKEGRPAINLRHVTRYIYEREIAPIPPGMRLYRTDHTPTCPRRPRQCAHFRCVNPWHLRLIPGLGGIYERDVSRNLTDSEAVATYKRRVRRNSRDREHISDEGIEPHDQKGLAPG